MLNKLFYLKIFLLALFFVVFSFYSPKQIFAGCVGTMQCQYFGNCTWSVSGETCGLSERGDTDPVFGTCECDLIDGPSYPCAACAAAIGCSGSCITGWQNAVSGGNDCTVLTGSCTATPSCGDGSCTGGETCASCPTDCSALCVGCGDGVCDSAGGEDSCNCLQDCPGTCSGGSCSGDQGCNVLNNCGENGWSNAIGDCPAGQVCCKTDDGSGSDPNCCTNSGWLASQGWGSCTTQEQWDDGWYAYTNGECCIGNCPQYPECGQDNGCGTTCPGNQDAGIDSWCLFSGTPQLSPIDENGLVTLALPIFDHTNIYSILVYPEGTAAQCPPTNPNAFCDTINVVPTSYAPVSGRPNNPDNVYFSFYPNPSFGANYIVQSQQINSTCGYEQGSVCNHDLIITADIEIEFHEDANGSCNTSNPVDPGFSSSAVTLDGHLFPWPLDPVDNLATVTISDGSGYNEIETIDGTENVIEYFGDIVNLTKQTTATIAVPYSPLGNYTVALTPGTMFDPSDFSHANDLVMPPGGYQDWKCACPDGCAFSGVSSPGLQLKFYVSDKDLTNGGWFQTLGGNLFSAQVWPNSAIVDPIPVDTCEASINCTANTILKDLDTRDDSAGFAVTGGGSIDSSNEDGEQTGYITQRAEQTRVMGNTLENVTENYSFFARQYQLGANPTDNSSDFGSPNNSALEPSVSRDYYYVSSNFKIKEPWTVSTGESYVIFVDGNLIISDEDDYLSLIDVEEGGFLAFIVAGNINIDANVGNNADLDTLTSNIEGIFIADGLINFSSIGEAAGGDERFVGEGIFVGWSGINLSRDYSNGAARKEENNIRPVETFIYRPDLLFYAPEAMAKPRLLWQESN